MHVEEYDQAIGIRLKRVRVEKGYTQQQLAKLCEVSSQQIHKYESGMNRISAGKLAFIAAKLSMPVTEFYEGLIEGEERPDYKRMDMQIARNFNMINDPKCKEALGQLIRQMATEGI